MQTLALFPRSPRSLKSPRTPRSPRTPTSPRSPRSPVYSEEDVPPQPEEKETQEEGEIMEETREPKETKQETRQEEQPKKRSRSRSRGSQARRSRSPRSKRSRSPPRAPRARAPPPRGGYLPTFKRGKPLIVFLFDDPKSERSWKEVFHRFRYTVYDAKLPFRIAAQTIIRTNNKYPQDSAYASYLYTPQFNKLVSGILDTATTVFGRNFEVDYFYDWFRHLEQKAQEEGIVIFSSYFSSENIGRLRAFGATICGTTSRADMQFKTFERLSQYLESRC